MQLATGQIIKNLVPSEPVRISKVSRLRNLTSEDIINSTYNQKQTKFNQTIETNLTEENVKKKIAEQTKKMAHSDIDYRNA
jgi:hypothetical protein